MTSFIFPLPLPIPTEQDIRDTGWSGDVTRYPLTSRGYIKRCEYNGLDPCKLPPNAAWYYAPNPEVQHMLNVVW